MKNALCAVLVLVPLAGCAIATESEQTGSSSEALTPVEHSVVWRSQISEVPRTGAVSVSHLGGNMLPEPPPTPGGPSEATVLGGGLDVPEPTPAPGGPVERAR